MIRVVFDTNIFISALHFRSSIPRRLLELAEENFFRLMISKQILAEIRGVLSVKFGYESEKLDALEELLLPICEIVEPITRLKVVKNDPDDDKIIECAMDGAADYLVSGDKHLLNLRKYKKIVVVNPREFLENLQN